MVKCKIMRVMIGGVGLERSLYLRFDDLEFIVGYCRWEIVEKLLHT